MDAEFTQYAFYQPRVLHDLTRCSSTSLIDHRRDIHNSSEFKFIKFYFIIA